MTLAIDSYATIGDLVKALDRNKNPNMKLAFCFMGGGARGAYHSGVLEGMMQEAAKSGVNLQPDMLVGTSVGSLVAYAHWLERLYPATVPAPYKMRQSLMWRDLADKNHAAEQLFDQGYLIDYATGQKKIPLLSDILNQIQAVQTSWNALQGDLLALASAANTLSRDISQPNLTTLRTNLTTNTTKLVTDLGGLSASLNKLARDIGSAKALSVLPDLASVATSTARIAGDSAETAITASNDLATLLNNNLSPLLNDAQTAIGKVLKLAVDGATLAGNALAIAAELTAVVTAMTVLLEVTAVLFIGGGGVTVAGTVAVGAAAAGKALLKDHLLDPTGLRSKLSDYMKNSPGIPAVAPTTDESVRKNWLSRSGSSVPELFVTGANLTARRLTVFAVARDASLQNLANSHYQVVDLANAAHSAHTNIFTASNMSETLIEAVMTSAAIPVAFPPHTWTMARSLPSTTQPNLLSHKLVDGGVIDNSPIDIARRAGATHIVSFELTPLLTFTTGAPAIDRNTRTMFDVYTDSFETVRDAVNNRQVLDIIAANHGAATPVPIYRIAPLAQHLSKSAENTVDDPTVQFLDFNGHYDHNQQLTLNLEDWFMQGYQDARLLSSAAMANSLDPLYASYVAHAHSGSGATQKVDFSQANKAWVAVNVAFPVTAP